MRFRRRVSKCPYLLGKGSPQTAPTFAVVPYHPTGSDFPISSAQAHQNPALAGPRARKREACKDHSDLSKDQPDLYTVKDRAARF